LRQVGMRNQERPAPPPNGTAPRPDSYYFPVDDNPKQSTKQRT